MKFKNPKTGEVFSYDNLGFCNGHDCNNSCPIFNAAGFEWGCDKWVLENQNKAAQLMGYEILEDDMESKIETIGKYKVGDRVRVVALSAIHNFRQFEVVTIASIAGKSHDEVVYYCTGECGSYNVLEHCLEPLDENDTEPENDAVTPKFKPGDKVKIIGNISGHSFGDGEIVNVVSLSEIYNDGAVEYRCSNGSNWWYVMEEDMEQVGEKKPRICEVLCVDVGERFKVLDEEKSLSSSNIWFNDNGVLCCDGHLILPQYVYTIHAINHPESIVKRTKLTQDELEICKLIGAKYITMNEYPYEVKRVDFWNGLPELYMEGGRYKSYRGTESVENISFVYPDKMPSIRPGDCICAEDYL